MKKILLLLTVLGVAANISAQGTLYFANYVNGLLLAPIFGPDPSNPTALQHGQSAEFGIPSGPMVYNGPLLNGAGFTVALYAGTFGLPAQALQLAATTTFISSTINNLPAGLWMPSIVTIAGVAPGQRVTVDVRVWDNRGGSITSWEQALQDATVARGSSGAFSPLGLLGGTPAPLDSPLIMMGMTSFNIAPAVPEPSFFDFLGLGVLLVCVRKFA